MAAYVIAGVDVDDAAGHAEYGRHVAATLEPFDGQFVVRGGDLAVLEGAWPARRTVVIAFPSREQAEAWYASAAYEAIKHLRLGAARTHFLVIVDGVA